MSRWITENDWITEVGLQASCVYTFFLGYRCGYVRVPDDSPIFGVNYDNIRAANNESFDVHGGLTFSGPRRDSEGSIDFTKWWFGFDCNHYGDANANESGAWGIHRTQKYVEAECENLARQLILAKKEDIV